MNREYTIPELKKLLEKAESEVVILKKKNGFLEKMVVEFGGAVPSSFEESPPPDSDGLSESTGDEISSSLVDEEEK